MKYNGIKPVYNVWLSKDDGKYFGPGVATLIEGVKRTGSLSSAAKEIGMAYSKAWRIIKRSEELMGCKLLLSRTGGAHGGGAFSGKDPTKVDRSAAYAARWVAKNVVAAGLASKCQIQLAYAIGVARPVSVMVDTFGTGVVADDALEAAVEKVFDLRPTAIIRDLDLRKPIYRKLAAYGHMGREDLGVAWEKTDRVEALKAALGK